MRIAISWSLKESCYSEAPHLPAIDAVLPQDRCELEKHVQELHTAHGTEVSFYWCYPFWVLAAQLQSQGIVVAGLRDFERQQLQPDCIVVVDLPLQRRSLRQLQQRYSAVPLVLLVAETPLERQAQHQQANLYQFDAVLTYNQHLASDFAGAVLCNLPFRFPRPPELATWRQRLPQQRRQRCTYVGNAQSSGWRRSYKHALGRWRGLPMLWQFMQGWSLSPRAAWRDEQYGAYRVRTAAVLAARSVFRQQFQLCGRGWKSGGTAWFHRLFPDRRLNLVSDEIGMQPGSKLSVLCDSTFTLACENYLGDPGYVSEKLFDAMAAGSIPIYIGAPGSLPPQLQGVVIDWSDQPRHVLHSPRHLAALLQQLARMPDQELWRRQQACLNFMDQHYERHCGLEPFLEAFGQVMQQLG